MTAEFDAKMTHHCYFELIGADVVKIDDDTIAVRIQCHNMKTVAYYIEKYGVN